MYGDWLMQEWAGKVTQYLIQLRLCTSINACTYLLGNLSEVVE